MIPKNVNRVHVGWCLNQHYSSRFGVQSCKHIYGVCRACHHHQVTKVSREILFSVDLFYEKFDQALCSLLWTILECGIGLRRAYDMLHSIEQFRCQQCHWVWMTK